MKINKTGVPVKSWVKKALCSGAILGLAASMGAPTAMASGFDEFTPFKDDILAILTLFPNRFPPEPLVELGKNAAAAILKDAVLD